MVFPIGLNYAYPYCWKCYKNHSMFVDCEKLRKAGDTDGPMLQRVERDSPTMGEQHELLDRGGSGGVAEDD